MKQKAKKKRKCALPGCFHYFVPDHKEHYFHHHFCHQEARLLYGAGSQLRGEADYRLIAGFESSSLVADLFEK